MENGAGRRGRLRFLLVGDGPLKKGMEQTLEAHGVAEAAVFTGIAAADHVPGLLNAADILVAPNVQMPEGKSFFGSPTKLFEYMATGKAVVASNLDQLAEVLSDGETALLVPPDDAERLAVAIETLAEDEELRSRIGANARTRVLEGHTWRHNALRVVEALERLGPPAPSGSRSGGTA
jgi:glycosyltransferase involved in cell wall biosynthesis